jgi:hypothetical protein
VSAPSCRDPLLNAAAASVNYCGQQFLGFHMGDSVEPLDLKTQDFHKRGLNGFLDFVFLHGAHPAQCRRLLVSFDEY